MKKKKLHSLLLWNRSRYIKKNPCRRFRAVLFFVFWTLPGLSLSAADDLRLDVDVLADLRLWHASGERSWFSEWLGKSRYGENGDQTAQADIDLAEISVTADFKYGWDWSAFVLATYMPELGFNGHGAADFIEAFVKYKPAPSGRLSYSGRLGLMFPHISRENVGKAWTSPYSITPSAINSWVGEEIRTLGLENTAKYRFNHSELSLTLSAFGLNDTAGALLHYRGWAFGDYKVGAFSRVPLPKIPSIYGCAASDALDNQNSCLFPDQARRTNPVAELDNRVGYYAGLDWSNRQNLKIGAFYYNNRGKPEVLKKGQYGWHTTFINFYVDFQQNNWSIISQAMTGSTKMGGRGTGPDMLDINPAYSHYHSAFLLVSKKIDSWRLSARADGFRVVDQSYIDRDNNNEEGWSMMMSASYQLDKRVAVFSELLHIRNKRPVREKIDLPQITHINQMQISLRLQF